MDIFRYMGSKEPKEKIYVREDEVLQQVEEVFKRIGISDPEILKETLEYLKSTNELKESEHDQATAALKKEHTENENKLNSLIDLRLSGELSKEEFQTKKQQLKDRQYEIDRLLKVYDEADDKFTDTATTLITLASQGYETFKGSKNPIKTQNDKIRIFEPSTEGQKT